MSRHPSSMLLLVFGIACLLLAGCAPPAACFTPTPTAPVEAVPTHTPAPKGSTPAPTHTLLPVAGELHLAVREDIKTLNPYLASSASEAFVVSLLYDTLLDYDWREGLQPNLAERWDLAPDGISLTFWLGAWAKWHDGRPVSAQDVVFSFNFVRQVQFPGLARLIALVDRAEAISPQEIKFTLLTKEADAARLVGTALRIVPAHVWQKADDPLDDANWNDPSGSGPFVLVERTQGKQLVLSSTASYHRSRPRIDRLVIEILRDEGKALQTLKDGKVDVLGWDVAPQIAGEVQNQAKGYAGIRLMEAPGTRTQTLLLNLRKPPYDNHAFRQALAQAVDVTAIISATLAGFGDVATPALFAPDSPWRNASISAVTFAPQEAVKKLEEAGFLDRNGDGLRENPDGSALQMAIKCPNAAASLRVAGLVVADWRAVGLAAKAEPVAQDALLPMLMQAQFDVALHNISLDEPEMAFFCFHTSRGLLRNDHVAGLNYGGYASAEYDELAALSLEEPDPDRQRELLYGLQAILAADLPQIPLYVPRVLNLYRDDHFTGWDAQPGIGLLSRTAVVNLQAR